MRDDDDGGAFNGQTAQDREEAIYLAQTEDGGWFIEQQQARAAHQRFGDLEPLALAEREMPNGILNFGQQPQASQHRGGAIAHAVEIEPESLAKTEGDVLDQAQFGREGEVLMHNADPVGERIGRFGEVRRLTIDGNRAAVWLVQAAEQREQGRFTGAVFPEQRVNFAGVELERNRIVGKHRSEPFGDPARLQHRGAWFAFAHRGARLPRQSSSEAAIGGASE